MPLTLTLLSALALAAPSDSIAGKWQIKGDVVGNPVLQECAIVQAGAVLTGSCKSRDGKPHDLTGEVKDGKITFKHAEDYDGQVITLIYTVATSVPSEFKGTIEVLPFAAQGTFTATPVSAKP